MTKVKQSKQDLLLHLQDHCRFLEVSAKGFDEGFVGEGKRMATTLRVLLHDTKNSYSLLKQLDLKTTIKYFNTAHKYDENNLVSHLGLLAMSFSKSGGEYHSLLGQGPTQGVYVSFEEWWEEIVISDFNKNKFSRKELVLNLANKDGGAHVDPKLTKAYTDLSRNNSIGWVFTDGKTSTPFEGVELHSIRQISYEFLESINKILPELLG